MSDKEELKRPDMHSKATRVGEAVFLGKPYPILLEGYVIQREIGRGGMAVVYEAFEKSLNRTIALKVLNKELSQDKELLNRFVNEAQAAARLNHPNIVQIYSIGKGEGVYYFTMEYVRGKSVEDVLSTGKRIAVAQCVNIITQTVMALQEAYKNNIVHRDIKPGNLLITEQGTIKVADFGLAAEIKGAQAAVGGKIIGTPLYISPEQAQGKEGDFRSDMYSLGITLYQMLVGKPPFVSGDTKVMIQDHIEKPLPPLPEDIPNQLKRLVCRLTDKNPDKRYNDYKSLLAELDKIYKALTSKRYLLYVLSLGLAVSIGITMYSFNYKPNIEEIVLSSNIERNKYVERVYKHIVEYAKKNPENQDFIIKEFFRIMKEYPDTEWAMRAEQKIDMIIMAGAVEASDELKRIKPQCDKFINERRYGEAVSKYKVLKDKYKDNVAASFAQENILYIMSRAREDFQAVEENARELNNQRKFNDVRELYQEVMGTFGIREYVKEARHKLFLIDELERRGGLQYEAEKTLNNIEGGINKLLDEHKYDEARKQLLYIKETNPNPVLGELIDKKLVEISESKSEYDNVLFKEEMAKKEKQYNYFYEVEKKIEELLPIYKYNEALKLADEGVKTLEILEWKSKLDSLREELGYLVFFKNDVITEINKELAGKNITNVSASEETLIFAVKGGYIGIPWKDSSPKKVYETAKKYIEDSADGHLAFGIFCMTCELYDEARKEFNIVLQKAPEKQKIVEKYLVQLVEKEQKK